MTEKEKLPVTILDCTLRDSGYVINFQFTARDVRNICEGLDKAGVTMIEVGHGLGLGASSPRHGIAFETDAEYIETAVAARTNAKIGAFFIPGIGAKEDILAASKSGLDFIRIGTNATDIDLAQDYVAYAKEQGLVAHLNIMKAYAVEPVELSRNVAQCKEWGLDSIYIVDSAGCMLPGQVATYIQAIHDVSGTATGFHGHNNLDLANANCLAALNAGATLVDGTLRGMGRSTGNAQTEVLSHILEVAGYQTGLNIFTLFDTTERFLTPLMPFSQGQSSLDVIIGVSKFHSGFLPLFKRALAKNDVDLNRLIMLVSQIDCVNPSEELIETVAQDMRRTDA